MFKLQRKQPEPTALETAIDLMCGELMDRDSTDEGSIVICTNVKVLCEAQASVTTAKSNNSLSTETLVNVIGSLAGIGMILSYEHVNVITSKALGFVTKPKA